MPAASDPDSLGYHWQLLAGTCQNEFNALNVTRLSLFALLWEIFLFVLELSPFQWLNQRQFLVQAPITITTRGPPRAVHYLLIFLSFFYLSISFFYLFFSKCTTWNYPSQGMVLFLKKTIVYIILCIVIIFWSRDSSLSVLVLTRVKYYLFYILMHLFSNFN